MSKCYGILFLQLLLFHLLINKISSSEEGFLHHFLLHILPLKLHPYLCLILSLSSCPHCLRIHIPFTHDLRTPLYYVPIILPLLHLHVFSHIHPLKNHPSLCLIIFPSYCPSFIFIRLPLSLDLHPPLHYVPLFLPLLHIHVFPHIRPLKPHPSICLLIYPSSCTHCLRLRLPLSHNLHPPRHYVHLITPLLNIHVFPHTRPLKLHPSLFILLSPSSCTHCHPLRSPLSHALHPLLPLHIFLPLPLHYYYLHIPHYHFHLNHRIQIIQ